MTPHPITSHLRHATEHLRSANHATYTDHREVTDLYDTSGRLTALLDRLPQLLAHLSRRIVRADAAVYTTDHDSPAPRHSEYRRTRHHRRHPHTHIHRHRH